MQFTVHVREMRREFVLASWISALKRTHFQTVEAVSCKSLSSFDVVTWEVPTLQLVRVQQGNYNKAIMCFRKRSLCKLYSTGFIAELSVTNTILVVCTEEYICRLVNEDIT